MTGFDVMANDGWSALAVSIVNGVCPEVAFLMLRYGRDFRKHRQDISYRLNSANAFLFRQLRRSGMSWREISEYTAHDNQQPVVTKFFGTSKIEMMRWDYD